MDSRVSTHVCLTARALGADWVIVADSNDKTIEATIVEVGGETRCAHLQRVEETMQKDLSQTGRNRVEKSYT